MSDQGVTKGLDIHIQKVNGIADLTVSLGEPGVYVARAPNGAGKTSAIRAIRAAAGDREAIAEPTDGVAQGLVEMGGVRLIVGRQRRLNGQPSVHLADDASLGKLIDPRLKEPKAANRARIDALLRLVPLPADAAALRELTDNDLEFAATIKGVYPDALALAGEVKRHANDEARRHEHAAARALGEVDTHRKLISELGAWDPAAGTIEDARHALDAATQAAAVARAEADAREQLEAQQADIRATLGDRPDLKAAESAQASALAALAAAQRTYDGALAFAQTCRADADKWDRSATILTREVKGATRSQAESIEASKAAATAALARAETLARYKDSVDKMGDAQVAADEAKDKAERYRKLAASTHYALGRLLERAGIPGLSIDDEGFLVAEGRSFADRLSFGQKVRLALEVALHAHRKRGAGLPCILQLEPEFWLALDAEHQKEVAVAAKEHGVWLLTEAPDVGELRIEEMK